MSNLRSSERYVAGPAPLSHSCAQGEGLGVRVLRILPDVLQVPVRRRVEEEVVGRRSRTVAVHLMDEVERRSALFDQLLELVVVLVALVEVHLRLRLAEDGVDLGILPAGVAG